MTHFVPNCGLITTSQKTFHKDCSKIFPIMLALAMLDAFRDLLCPNYAAWHNTPGPSYISRLSEKNYIVNLLFMTKLMLKDFI